MDLSPILDGVLSVAGTVIIGTIPALLPRVLKLLSVSTDAAHEESLENTLTTAVGAAISYGESAGDPRLKDVTIKNNALNAAAAFALDDAPKAIAALGYSKESIAEVIDARISHAMATSGPVVPATVPAAVQTVAKVAEAAAPVLAALSPTISDVTFGSLIAGTAVRAIDTAATPLASAAMEGGVTKAVDSKV